MPTVYIQYCSQPFNVSPQTGEVLPTCPGMRKQIAVALETLAPASTEAIPKLGDAQVAAVFGFAFSTVVFFFLLGRGVGVVLSLIRKG